MEKTRKETDKKNKKNKKKKKKKRQINVTYLDKTNIYIEFIYQYDKSMKELYIFYDLSPFLVIYSMR